MLLVGWPLLYYPPALRFRARLEEKAARQQREKRANGSAGPREVQAPSGLRRRRGRGAAAVDSASSGDDDGEGQGRNQAVRGASPGPVRRQGGSTVVDEDRFDSADQSDSSSSSEEETDDVEGLSSPPTPPSVFRFHFFFPSHFAHALLLLGVTGSQLLRLLAVSPVWSVFVKF